MGSHKAGSTSPLPPCVLFSHFFLKILLWGSSACLPTIPVVKKKRQEGGGAQPLHMHGGEERQGGAGSGLPVLSCERQTFGRVITRRTALGVISDSCLFKVFGAHSLYGPRLPSLRLMFRLHLHQEESCMCQHKQCACEEHRVCTRMCFTATNCIALIVRSKV